MSSKVYLVLVVDEDDNSTNVEAAFVDDHAGAERFADEYTDKHQISAEVFELPDWSGKTSFSVTQLSTVFDRDGNPEPTVTLHESVSCDEKNRSTKHGVSTARWRTASTSGEAHKVWTTGVLTEELRREHQARVDKFRETGSID